jgi:hypothetical protein
MTMRLSIEPKEFYLEVRISGQFELAEAEATSDEFLQACAEGGHCRVLVDFRAVEGGLSVMDRWNYSTHLAHRIIELRKSGRIPNLRMAYLGREPTLDPKRFGETVAVNRGVDVRATDDFAEAVRWLESR